MNNEKPISGNRPRCAAAHKTIILAGSLLLSAFTVGVEGLTRRHDRADSLYQNFADEVHSYGGMITGDWLGSGTLISPTWILSANHALQGATTFTLKSGSYSIVESYSYPGLDIGVGRLNTPVIGIDPVRLYSLDFGVEESREGIILGAGRTGTGHTGAVDPAGTRRAGEADVFANASTWGWSSSQVLTRFRTPAQGAGNLEAGVGPGDSGGGLLLEVDGEWCIAGVLQWAWHSGDNEMGMYGTGGTYVRSAPVNDWILSHATDAKVIPEPGSLVIVITLAAMAALIKRNGGPR